MNITVIKLSGNVVADAQGIERICAYVKNMLNHNRQVVLVHGGGKQINELSGRLGLKVRQIAGRRITDSQTLEVLLYTVGGKVNKELVADLQKKGIQAAGITGIDGGLTWARIRPPLDIDGSMVDFGKVGEIERMDTRLPETLINAGYVPVIGCLTWSAGDGVLNINADTFSLHICLGLKAAELVVLMEPPAVLDEKGCSIKEMTWEKWQTGLRQGWIREGMRPKLQNGFHALERGVESVVLANPETLAAGTGTRLIRKDNTNT